MRQATIEKTKKIEQQFLTFNLAGQLFAIDIAHVKEIIAYGGISYIPLAPKFVKGVLNLRGHSVPVLDLAFRFKKYQSEITKITCNVIVEVEKNGQKLDIGLMVDSVNEVINIDSENIDPSPDFGTDVHIDFINGIGKVDGNFIVIINAQAILDVKDFSALEETMKYASNASGKSDQESNKSAEGTQRSDGEQKSEMGAYLQNIFGSMNLKEGSIAAKAKSAALAAAEAAAKAAAVAAAAEKYEDAISEEELESAKAEAEAALADAATAANEALLKAKQGQAELMTDEPASKEPVLEEVVEDEPSSNELGADESSSEEPAAEENNQDDAIPDEPVYEQSM